MIPTIPGYKPLYYFQFGEYEKRFTNYNNETDWTENQRVSLIENIILDADKPNHGIDAIQLDELAFPKIIMRRGIDVNPQDYEHLWRYDVLDGFQRIKTLHDFFRGKILIPRSLVNSPIFKGLESEYNYEGTPNIGVFPGLPDNRREWVLLIQYPVEIV
jgi:hypothetical protein